MIRRRRTSTAGAVTPRPRRVAARPAAPLDGSQPAGPGVGSITAAGPNRWLRNGLWAVAIAVTLGVVFWLLWPVFAILVAAAAVAYILDPAVDRFEARGLSREVGIGILLVALVAASAVVLLVMVPPFIRKLGEIGALVQDFFATLDTRLAPAAAWIEEQTGYQVPLDVDDLQQQMPGWIEQALPKIQGTATAAVQGLFTRGLGVINAVLNLTLLPLFAFYLLRDWDRLLGNIGDLVPPMLRPRVFRVAGEVDQRLSAFVRGQLTVCAALGVLYSLGLWIAGIDLPLTVGLLSGALFIVPYLGTIVGIVLASLLSIVEYGFDIHLLWVLVVFGVVQAIEGYLLTPKIVGDQVGLHPLVVIIALIVGGSLLGIWGMLVAIPVTATLSVLAGEWVEFYQSSSFFREDETPGKAG